MDKTLHFLKSFLSGGLVILFAIYLLGMLLRSTSGLPFASFSDYLKSFDNWKVWADSMGADSEKMSIMDNVLGFVNKYTAMWSEKVLSTDDAKLSFLFSITGIKVIVALIRFVYLFVQVIIYFLTLVNSLVKVMFIGFTGMESPYNSVRDQIWNSLAGA